MALADVSQVFNTIAQQQAGQRQQQEITNQAQQAKAQQALEEKRLELQHEHEQAVLAATQAFQRVQQANTLSQMSPSQTASFPGAQVTPQYSQPMTAGPTNELANQQPTGQRVTIPDQAGGSPYIINQPTQTEAARQAGQSSLLAQQPFEEFKSSEEQKVANIRAQAEQNSAMMRAYLDHEHDMQKAQLERESAERIAAANNAARLNEERLRSSTEFGVEKMRQQGMYDPNRVSQAVQDLYNGNTTQEDFNRSPLSKYEKENTLSGLAMAGAHPLNKSQEDYINQIANIKNIVPIYRDFILAQPNTTILGHNISGIANATFNSEQRNRLEQLSGSFGNLSRALSTGVSTGRIPIFEAQKIMEMLPSPDLPPDENLKRFNNFKTFMGSNLNNALSNIPMDQRNTIVDKKIGSDLFKHYIDIPHLQQDSSVDNTKQQQSNQIPKVTTKQDFDKLPKGSTYINTKDNQQYTKP